MLVEVLPSICSIRNHAPDPVPLIIDPEHAQWGHWGACKSGLSCIHTAFILQETVATSLEANGHCFVAFYDVAKAFDTVWIDGLFKQLFDLGITGKTLRLLYRGYIDFECRVRIRGSLSDPYKLSCGIHQGGYLSLLKYTVFINSLLTNLRDSNLCAKIYRIPSTP